MTKLVRVDELIRALKGCSIDAKVFLASDEELNELKPLDGQNISNLFSSKAVDDNEWEMVKAHLTDRNEKFIVLTPIG